MASNRRKYFRRTRKTRMRDLKHSPTGILSFCTAMAALAVFLTAVVQSFLASGEGGYKVGGDRKSTRLNSSHNVASRMPSSA